MTRRSKNASSSIANVKKARASRWTRNEQQAEQAAGSGDQLEQPASISLEASAPVTDTAGSSTGPTAADDNRGELERAASPTGPTGRRIINISALTTGIDNLMAHTKDCWQPSFVGERRQGLDVFLRYQCHKCGAHFDVAKEDKKSLNNQAVYAAVTTGSGFSSMEAQMALLDIPFMSFKHFSELEEDVGEVRYVIFNLYRSVSGDVTVCLHRGTVGRTRGAAEAIQRITAGRSGETVADGCVLRNIIAFKDVLTTGRLS